MVADTVVRPIAKQNAAAMARANPGKAEIGMTTGEDRG